jgi:hypothetical protein
LIFRRSGATRRIESGTWKSLIEVINRREFPVWRLRRVPEARQLKLGAALLPVLGQNFLAGLAQAAAVLLQACQHGLIAIAHYRPAMTRHVAGAGVMPLLLRRRRRSHQDDWNNA